MFHLLTSLVEWQIPHVGVLSVEWKTKMLIRLCECAGWSASLLFAYAIWQGFLWCGSVGLTEKLLEAMLKPPHTIYTWTDVWMEMLWISQRDNNTNIYFNKAYYDIKNNSTILNTTCITNKYKLWTSNRLCTNKSLQLSQIHMSHAMRKCVFRSLRPGQTQTGLRSHRS